MSTVHGWTATTESGEVVERDAAPGLFASVPRPVDLPEDAPWPLLPADTRAAAVRDLSLVTDRGTLRALVQPARGERVRVFTRRAVRVNPQGAAESVSVPVIELETGGSRVRVFVADGGIIIATDDVNF